MSGKPYVTISVFLRGDHLDPDLVYKTIGIKPDRSQKKGEKRGGTRPNSSSFVTKIGTWWLGVDNKSRAEQDMISEVPQLVDELLQMFDGCKQPLDKIAGVEEGYLDILILDQIKDKLDNGAEFTLNKNQILRASQLGLAISVATSFNEPEKLKERE